MFNKMKLGFKLIGGFLIVTLITVFIGIMGIMNMGQINDMLNKLYDKHLLGISYIKEANIDLICIGRAVRQAVIAPDFVSRKAQLDNLEKFDKDIRDFLEKTKGTIVTEEGKNKLDTAVKSYDDYYNEISSFKTLVENSSYLNIDQTIINGMNTLISKGNTADDTLGAVSQMKEKLGKDMYNESDAIYQRMSILLIILVIAAAIAGFSIGIMLSRSITNPMKKLMDMVNKISDGDYSHAEQVKTKSQDEIGILTNASNKMLEGLKNVVAVFQKMAEGDLAIDFKESSDKDELGTAMNKMIGSLNELLSQVNIAIQQVATGSNQVSQASQNLSQGATEQASSLEEITSSITEMSSQTKQNTESAIQVNSLAKTAKENAEQGNGQMKELVTAMTDINKSSDEIKKIVKAIDDIAFQINLLALNANVEAARAGKYGKGFAVVADEVRNLAVRSADAVKETTRMVEESITNISRGNNLVEVTAKQLDAIVSGAAKVADLAEEVATASKEQAQGLEQINTGLGQIDQVTQANTASSEECASASEELSSQAQQLKGMIAKFKLKVEKFSKTGDLNNLSPEILEMIKKEVSKNQGHQVSHLDSLSKHENAKIELKTTSKPQKKLQMHMNPKEVIALDDDNFGKF